jgi:ABC-type multidrug transport system ATPase subunit
MTAPPTIAVDGLAQRAGRRPVLDGLSFKAGRGVLGVLGPNGAGKTTLLRTLATAVPPARGDVRILGLDVRVHRDRGRIRRQLGYVPQVIGYYPHFTVAQFVEYIALLKGVPRHQAPDAVERALRWVDLAGRATTKLGALSGGMLRRAGIGQALVNDPAVIIMDEPTAGLDPQQRAAFRRLIDDLGRERTVVISTHLVEDIAALADRILVLDRGRLRFDGTPAALARLAGHDEPSTVALEAGFDLVLEGTQVH